MNEIYFETPLMKLDFFGHFLLRANKATVNHIEQKDFIPRAFINMGEKIDFYWAYCMLPEAFPMEWSMHKGAPTHYENDAALPYCLMIYFKISIPEFEHLFVARLQQPKVYGGIILDYDADAWELGANIIWFIKNRMKNN